MLFPVYVIYVITVGWIRVYKWLELQFFKLLLPLFRYRAKGFVESIGCVFHGPGDREWTEEEDKKLLARCSKKFDRVIHLTVKDDSFYTRTANLGTLAAGECYMDEVFDVRDGNYDDLTEFGRRWMEADLMDMYWHPWNRFLEWLELQAFNLQTRKRAFQGVEHYDLGDDLFETLLDPHMQYTCGYWARAKNLNEAQEDKMHLIAKKLNLKPGMKVLDIGCGWGYLCTFLAKHYDVECVGVTLAESMVKRGKKISKGMKVDIRLQDYRDIPKGEVYDRVVSIGMLEHVGYNNYKEFFQIARRCLKDDGIFLLHHIARNHLNIPRSEPWTHKYIFPNGAIPCVMDIAKFTKGLWIIEDWHNIGQDYAKTLDAWRQNFLNGWPKIEKCYGPRFFRMWMFYLSFSKALFLSRRLHLWQIVLSKDGLKKEYRAAR